MDVKFFIAQRSDVVGIIQLCNQCFEESTSVEYALKVFDATCNDPNQIYVIGKLNNEIVAHAKITVIPTMYEKMNTYAILNHVCVKPDYRRHNIATSMLDFISEICKDKKCVKMELWSNNVRIAAHSCYKNYGFELEEAGFFSKEI